MSLFDVVLHAVDEDNDLIKINAVLQITNYKEFDGVINTDISDLDALGSFEVEWDWVEYSLEGCFDCINNQKYTVFGMGTGQPPQKYTILEDEETIERLLYTYIEALGVDGVAYYE